MSVFYHVLTSGKPDRGERGAKLNAGSFLCGDQLLLKRKEFTGSLAAAAENSANLIRGGVEETPMMKFQEYLRNTEQD